jgi:hypothetical protein
MNRVNVPKAAMTKHTGDSEIRKPVSRVKSSALGFD